MGRKGDSKRKTRATKSSPEASDNANSKVSTAVKTAESQPVRSVDAGKKAPSVDKKKKTKKG